VADSGKSGKDALIKVLIAEDDPMVADINKSFTEAIEGFTVVGIARNGKEALDLIRRTAPDLVILDVYMPNVEGTEVLTLIRRSEAPVDVIMVTAANDIATIGKVLRGGVVDYIIKPFKFERYRAVLESYREFRRKMREKDSLAQEELDQVLGPKVAQAAGRGMNMPKNLHPQTLNSIIDFLAACQEAQSAEEIAAAVGISRVTARRYMEYLLTQGKVQMVLEYIAVGRPVHRFRLIR